MKEKSIEEKMELLAMNIAVASGYPPYLWELFLGEAYKLHYFGNLDNALGLKKTKKKSKVSSKKHKPKTKKKKAKKK